MKFKKMAATLLASTLALSVVACGDEVVENDVNNTEDNQVVESNDDSEVSSETLTLGLMGSISALPIIVAEEQGYFAEEGLNVDIQIFRAAKDRDAALQANELDGVIADEVAIAIYQNGGIDMQITGVTDGAFTLVTAPESNILSFEDLKGKTVGISENTSIEYTLDSMVKANGLEVSDIEKVAIPVMPTRLEMVKTGEIDAAVMPNPFSDDAIAAGGFELAVADGSEIPFISVTAFLADVNVERSADVQAFYRAMNKASEYINSNDIAIFEDTIITELGYPEEMRGSIVIPTFRMNQLPSEDEINNVFDWCRENGLLNLDITAADVLNDVGVVE